MHADVGLGIDMHMSPTGPSRIAPPAGVKRSHKVETLSAKSDSTHRRRKTLAGDTRALALLHKEQQRRVQMQTQPLVAMRSSKAMEGLLLAEVGGSMVEVDKLGSGSELGGSKFKEGKHIEPGAVTPININCFNTSSPSKSHKGKSGRRFSIEYARGTSLKQGLERHGTLLSASPASSVRRAAELKTILGDSSAKVKSGAVVSSQKPNTQPRATRKDAPDAVALEQGRSRVRVALDMDLENNTVVEGGYISGTLLIRVRPKKKDEVLRLGGGKIRIAGFEVAPKNEDRSIFYQVTAPLMDISNGCDGLYSMPVDGEGFGPVGEGEYTIRFSMKLPLVGTGGKPRGVYNSRSGATIQYIVIASMKVVDPTTSKRSIAHFYRECEIWPSLDPATTLAPALDPILARAAKKLFMGGDGTIALTASLHRCTWVAGQPCYVRCRIANDTRKSVRSVMIALVRTMTLFRPRAKAVGFADEIDDGETATSERRVSESALNAGQKGVKGYASAKGWWTGVGSGEIRTVTHSITIPPDALTVPRARLIEVDYTIRVALGVSSMTGTSEAVHVHLPIRIVNFVSLDPPPCGPVLPPSTMASSVIDLDTPKPESYLYTRSSLSGGVGVGESTSETFWDSQYRGTETESGMHEGYPPSRSMPLPALATAHRIHDLGSVEDADDINGMLGDIPGSTSLLEEADIALDSGYSEGGHNEFSSDAYMRGMDWDVDDGRSVESGDVGEEEDVGSDEELERMVGCASARIDTGDFEYPETHPAYHTPLEYSMGGLYPSSVRRTAVDAEPIMRGRPSGNIQPPEGVRPVRGPRSMHVGQRNGQRMVMPDERHATRIESRSQRNEQPGSNTLRATRSVLRVVNPSEPVPDERPGSVYSVIHTVDESPCKSKRLRSITSSKHAVAEPRNSHRRPPVSRALTAPSSPVPRCPTLNGQRSRLSSSVTRTIVTENVNINPAAVTAGKSSSSLSPVRARIAVFEQKTREREEGANERTGFVRSGYGHVARSLTTSSISSYN